ncbi:MAG: Fe-S cluster assembly protein SufB [Candidatus Diapherotrites archaeon]|nr:Fe-S cluster assembly protein SufB [Candidatus Diapherotrites archaeon]
MFADIARLREEESNRYNFLTNAKPAFKAPDGYNEELIHQISDMKKEPEWMRSLRLEAYKTFLEKPLPSWGPDLSGIDFGEISYFIKPEAQNVRRWEDVPAEIKDTFEKLGIPEAERKHLAGSVAQYESDAVYHNLKKKWEDLGVIFTDMDSALREHPELVREHFMRAVPIRDNKFSALHASVWSGGSFLYVPKGVHIDQPLQTYFRMNSEKEGQFEHTLLIFDEGSKAQYLEGCTAPKFSSYSLHSAVVEIYVKDYAQARYTTVQNWSKNVYNLNTKRAIVGKQAKMEWVGGSLGSLVTMLYPCSVLRGEGASADHLNIAFGADRTWKDGGAKVIHAAPNTSSRIIAKSISMRGGTGIYRGLVRINAGAKNARSHVICDALILDKEGSVSSAYPHNEIEEPTATFTHEATVNRVSAEKIFYLRSRGLNESEAMSMIVLGFLNDVAKEIPLEFAVEFSRLVRLEMSKLPGTG